jgi:uncharacterized protein (DUF983 family)
MVQLNPEDIERPFAKSTMRRIVTMLGRALVLRCPNCGSRGLVKNWFKMDDRCPTCGIRIEREGNDYLSGSVMFNLVLAEMIFAVALVSYLLIAWPKVNWDTLGIVAPLGMAVAPFVLFPFSKLVWLAADLALRPAHASELGGHASGGRSVRD